MQRSGFMVIDNSAGSAALNDRHRARLKIKAGRQSAPKVEIEISSSGLLAIGGPVSSILLSAAVVVAVAKGGRGQHAVSRLVRHDGDRG